MERTRVIAGPFFYGGNSPVKNRGGHPYLFGFLSVMHNDCSLYVLRFARPGGSARKHHHVSEREVAYGRKPVEV
jgi:hypothetical protein